MGQVSCPHFGQAATLRFTRVPHTTQRRPHGFDTSWSTSFTPSTRTDVNGRHPVPVLGSLLGFMHQVFDCWSGLVECLGTDRC
jgi:hypothetical protein